MYDVSTIMPVWNTPPALIQRAVDTACGQVGFQCGDRLTQQLVLVDDASESTETRAFVERIGLFKQINGTKITTVRNPVRRGCGGGRNAGIEHARGQWVALLDGDDNWYSTSLLARHQFATRNYFHFVYGMFVERVMYRDGTEILQRPPRGRDIFDQALKAPLTVEEMKRRILDHNLMAVFTMLVRRDKLLKVGGFEEPVICSEDWVCWRRIFELPEIKIGFLDEPLGNYNVYHPIGELNNHIRLDPKFPGAFHLNTEDPAGKAGQYLDAAARVRAAGYADMLADAEKGWDW